MEYETSAFRSMIGDFLYDPAHFNWSFLRSKFLVLLGLLSSWSSNSSGCYCAAANPCGSHHMTLWRQIRGQIDTAIDEGVRGTDAYFVPCPLCSSGLSCDRPVSRHLSSPRSSRTFFLAAMNRGKEGGALVTHPLSSREAQGDKVQSLSLLL